MNHFFPRIFFHPGIVSLISMIFLHIPPSYLLEQVLFFFFVLFLNPGPRYDRRPLRHSVHSFSADSTLATGLFGVPGDLYCFDRFHPPKPFSLLISCPPFFFSLGEQGHYLLSCTREGCGYSFFFFFSLLFLISFLFSFFRSSQPTP